jgi:hypothetical protein
MHEPIPGVVFGITERCYGLPKFPQFDVHFLQSGFGHIYDLLASIGNCGFFKIEQNLVDKGKTCVGVDFYFGGDLRQVVMVPVRPSVRLLGHLYCCTFGNESYAVCISATSFSRNPSLSSSLIGVLNSWEGTSFSFTISSSAWNPSQRSWLA